MTPIHHIYVDFENVQSIKLGLIAGKPVTVTLVLGRQQTSLPVDLTSKMLEHAGKVRIVQTAISGRNALDFVLACELGGKCALEPKACFHIISKDKGYDAVIEHLTREKISVARHESFAAVPVLAGQRNGKTDSVANSTPLTTNGEPQGAPDDLTTKRATPPTLDGRVAAISEWLQRCPANRPAREKTLLSSINARFWKELPEAEVQAVVNRMRARKLISVTQAGAVEYKL